jgi:hypothetical protein
MNFKESFTKLFFLHFEWVALMGLLLMAALINLESTGISFCIFDRVGFSFCPGEGIGRSIAFAFRGSFVESVNAHPAGLPAILIIITRVGSILYRNRQYHQTEEIG